MSVPVYWGGSGVGVWREAQLAIGGELGFMQSALQLLLLVDSIHVHIGDVICEAC